MAKIPIDAFTYYSTLGPQRSYETVAQHYGVSKRAVTKRAANEKWQERLQRIEQQARERADEQAAESMAAINTRHLKMFRAIQGKALQALQSIPLTSGEAAARALDAAIRGERLVLGEPDDRTAVTFEEVARREFERWMPAVTDSKEEDDASSHPPS